MWVLKTMFLLFDRILEIYRNQVCMCVFLCVSNVHCFKIQWLKKDSNLYSASCTAAEEVVFLKMGFSVKHPSNLRLASMYFLSRGGTQIISTSCLRFGEYFKDIIRRRCWWLCLICNFPLLSERSVTLSPIPCNMLQKHFFKVRNCLVLLIVVPIFRCEYEKMDEVTFRRAFCT